MPASLEIHPKCQVLSFQKKAPPAFLAFLWCFLIQNQNQESVKCLQSSFFNSQAAKLADFLNSSHHHSIIALIELIDCLIFITLFTKLLTNILTIFYRILFSWFMLTTLKQNFHYAFWSLLWKADSLI